uniref:CASP-like protein n=1 Tax=Lotus japonicus TaxID=34305 RepID=I3SZ85_LOTJA|nr:unknown [Lotus japonicus]
MTMELGIAKAEACLRVTAILFLVLTTCLVAFDSETKVVILPIEKKATYKDMKALKISMWVTSAAAGYNMLMLFKNSLISACSGGNFNGSYLCMAWIYFLLDQHHLKRRCWH